MPGGDRTGPSGEGQKTGRGLGICAGYDEPGYATPRGFGRGRGFRFGWRGRGQRFRFLSDTRPGWGRSQQDVSIPQDREFEEQKSLTQELKKILQGIQDRLDALEK
jgi:hypothetical protein